MDRTFAFDVEIPIRYRDLDPLNHVNNAVYGTYLEAARFEYFDEVLGVPFEDREMVLASVEMDFRRPITLADERARVECGVLELGDASFRMGYRVYAGGASDSAASAESVQVAWDGEGSRPIPETWRDRFRAFEPEL